MADLNRIAKTEEQIEDEQDSDEVNKIDLTIEDIQKGKLKFNSVREMVDYINDLKRVLDMTYKRRKEERGKLHASLYGDPKDNKSHFKGKIGLLQRFFDDPWLHGTDGAANSEIVVDQVKKIDAISNEMISFSLDTCDKFFFVLQLVVDMYADHTDKLEEEIKQLQAKVESMSSQPQVGNPAEGQDKEEKNSAKQIIGQFMDLYGQYYIDQYITEMTKPESEKMETRMYQIKSKYMNQATKFFIRYYPNDAKQKSLQLWDTCLFNAKKKLAQSGFETEKQASSTKDSKTKDVVTTTPDGLNLGQLPDMDDLPPNSGE